MKLEEIAHHISVICKEEFGKTVEVELARPDELFGDLSTNVAMRLAGKLANPPVAKPKEIAELIAKKLRDNPDFSKVDVAMPGFINIKLKDSVLFERAKSATEIMKPLEGKSIVCEYSDPNPFKALHAGHLYTTLVGDSISGILEAAGAKVHRVNFGGDVGLHVAKATWSIVKELGGENPDKLDAINKNNRAEWISEQYVKGNKAYKTNDAAKDEIAEINQKIYKIHSENDKASPLAKIYWTCRQWSYDGFDELYRRLNVKPFEKYYPESATVHIGLEKVKEHIGGVYEMSDGAVVFKGEKYGLFTQVFINKDGLPTYAGKDVGLIFLKKRDYSPDISYIITDISQKDHLAVVMKSIEQFAPQLVKNTIHQTHGRINLPGGKKMSSREGDVVLAADVLEAARNSAKGDQDEVILGAVRYSFLKNKVGGDIIYNPEESVSHEGNSGPYLQYALVRARGIAKNLEKQKEIFPKDVVLDDFERSLARNLSMYEDAFKSALRDYSPHHLCSYLYLLAQSFNRFYENRRVIGDPREGLRSELVKAYERVLAHGLDLLGMPKPEKM